MKDSAFSVQTAFPAAAANNNSAGFDLGKRTTPGSITPDQVEVEIATPALAGQTDSTKTITYKLQESADNVTFTDVVPSISTVVPGVASTGVPAQTVRFRLPATVKQYISINCAVLTGSASLVASKYTTSLIFH